LKQGQLLVILLLTLLGASSCKYFRKEDNSGEEKPLARVKDTYLYYPEVARMVKDAPKKDSAQIVDNYIDAWIKKQLMLGKAMDYLSDEEQDLEQQVKDYRESLLIFRYENGLVKEKMDTIVPDDAINKYYEQYPDNFELKDDIVQFFYVKVPKDAPKIDSARYLIRSERESDRKKLASYCFQYAEDFYIKDSLWYEVNRIYRQIPIEQEELQSLARNKMSGEVEDSSYIYLLKINNFRGRSELAPLDYVKEDITRIIINKRKIDLINATYESLYKDGVKKGDFEKY
jgi:hypothetical protein